MGGVESIEPQSGGGNLIKYRRFCVRMAVVARLLPAVIVTHEQHDVGTILGRNSLAAS